MHSVFASIVLLSLLLLSVHPGIAQARFTEGYLVTHTADTLRGYIKDKNWDVNPRHVKFQERLTGVIQTFAPHQIASFATESGDLYQSSIVSVDKSPVKLSELTLSGTPRVVTDTVFLLVYVRGRASLFYLKDEHEKVHFYWGRDGSSPEELLVKKSLREEKGKNVLVTSERFRGQLNAALSDCPAVKAAIPTVAYKRRALQKLFVRYNQCFTPGGSAYVAAPERLRLSVSLLVGGATTTLKFKGISPESLVRSTFRRSMGYTAGLGLDVSLPRNRQKWSLYNEIRWKSYQTKATYRQVRGENNFSVSDITFNMGYVSLVNAVRRHFPLGNFSPFINVGLFNAVAFQSDHRTVTESQFYSTRRVSTEPALTFVRRYEQGLVAGAGVASRRFRGELRYEAGNGVSAFTGLGSRTYTLSFLVSYRFN